MGNPLADGGQKETLGLLKFPKTRKLDCNRPGPFLPSVP